MRLTCALLILLAGVDGVDVGPAEFARLIEGLHADVADVTFVYEGWMRGIPPGTNVEEDMNTGPSGRAGGMAYQGGYSFRADGATRLDSYLDYVRDDSAHKSFSSRKLEVVLDQKLSLVDQFPDQRNELPTVRAGGSGVLNHTGSPERIHYSWFFRALKDPAARRYEFLGWENIGGHRCLIVQFDEVWGMPEQMVDRPTIRFWIDMERGGHPLQIEFRRGEKYKMRTAGIQLERLAGADGRERWFPVRGVTYVYPFPGPNYVDRPVAYETYMVLQGTVRFNQKLPDKFFSLDWKGSLPEDEKLAIRRKEFRKPPRRNDPDGIKQHLGRALADADEQSKQLEASSEARDPWSWTTVGQAGFAALGAFTILVVGIHRWKRR
jgi:hypothetical protein